MVGVVQKLLNFKTQNVVQILLSEIICHCVKITFTKIIGLVFQPPTFQLAQMPPFV